MFTVVEVVFVEDIEAIWALLAGKGPLKEFRRHVQWRAYEESMALEALRRASGTESTTAKGRCGAHRITRAFIQVGHSML